MQVLIIIFFGIASCALPIPALAQQDKPWLAVQHIDTALIRNAHSVIRLEESRYVIQSPQKYTHRFSRTVTILKSGSGEDEILVSYDKYSSAKIGDVALYDAHGKFIRKVKKTEISDHLLFSEGTFYHDERGLFLKISGGAFPYTIEYSYEVTYKETMFYAPWQPVGFSQSLENASFILQAPSTLAFFTEDRQSHFTHTTVSDAQYVTHTWTLQHHTAVREESNCPPDFDVLPVLLIGPSVFQVESFTGSMENWKSFGKFIYDINEGREKLSPEMAARVKEMVAGIEDPHQQVNKLYSWLQSHTRYVSVQLGIGGWQSYDALYVEKNKFGDCKALSTFMKGLLQAAGIDAWQVVIHWDPEPTMMARDFATHYFNHMMLHIPSLNMWLECTSPNLPAGMIDKYTEHKPALLITPDGGILTQTPGTPSEKNIILTMDTLYLDGSWYVRGKTTYSGNTQGDIRQVMHYIKASEQQKRFLEKYPLQIETLVSLTYDADPDGRQAICSYDLELRDFGTSSAGRLFIPLNAFHTIGNSCTKGGIRALPYISNNDHTSIHEVYIKIPGGYIPEFLPETKVIDHALGVYSMRLKIDGDYLQISRSLQHIPARIPADQYPSVCRFYEDIKKADATKIVFVSRT